jgi:small subunit ribosomal protein S3Ae
MVKGAKPGGRVRDKWRDNQWVGVNKPSGFEPQVAVNCVPITDVYQAKGRATENTLHDMNGNPEQSMTSTKSKYLFR